MRVIIRTEKDFDNVWWSGIDGKTFHYVAVFPDDKANPGRIACCEFKIIDGKVECYEGFDEMTLSWYYDCTKHVKRNILKLEGVLDAFSKWYLEDGVSVEYRDKLPNLSKTAWAWAYGKE